MDGLTWKKEYWLILVIVICLVLYFYRDKLNEERVQKRLALVPTIGGALFGLNTLINLVK